jgi:hypothetical protein
MGHSKKYVLKWGERGLETYRMLCCVMVVVGGGELPRGVNSVTQGKTIYINFIPMRWGGALPRSSALRGGLQNVTDWHKGRRGSGVQIGPIKM